MWKDIRVFTGLALAWHLDLGQGQSSDHVCAGDSSWILPSEPDQSWSEP